MKPFPLVLAFLLCISAFAQDNVSPRDQLKQYVSELQKNPTDDGLREKIIKLAATLDPKPATPEETRRDLARGIGINEVAKEPKDFNDAAAEFEKASLVAPWLAEPYRDLAIVLDKSGDYAAALRNIKLYLMTAPETAEADKAKDLQYKIEAKQEKAAKELAAKEEEQRRQAQAAEAARNAEEEKINAKRNLNRKFAGHWKMINIHGVVFPDYLILVLTENGDLGYFDRGYSKVLAGVELQTEGSRLIIKFRSGDWQDFQIASDGTKMTCRSYHVDDNDISNVTYVKQ